MSRAVQRTRGGRVGPIACVLAVALLSCGESPTELDTTPGSVTATPTDVTLSFLGEQATITAAVRNASGEALPDAVLSWTSATPAVVSVSSTGVVTAVADGNGIVIATSGSVADTVEVTVARVATGLEISGDASTFESIGETRSLTADAVDAGGSALVDPPVGWSSSDPAVVDIDADGNAEAQANGEATVVAALGAVADTIVLDVEQVVAGLAVSTPSGDVAPGLPVTVTVTGVDALGTVVEAYGESVTIELDANDQSATLAGGKSAAATDGVATFAALELSRSGTGYTLSAGDGEWDATSAPFDVRLRFSSIAAGASTACGLSFQGDAYCWGRNQTGGLGIGESGENVDRPTLVSGDLTFVQIDAGHSSNQGGQFDGFGCGVTDSADAYCWGRNDAGQLGNGTSGSDLDSPVLVSGGYSFASVSAGRDHACGLTTGGAVYCWGSNTSGRLGIGSSMPEMSAEPLEVAGGRTYTSLEVGLFRSCAISTDDETYCWHSNTGLPAQTRFSPTIIPGSVQLVDIDPGTFLHLCGVTADGTGYCWGRNPYGELGVADMDDRAEPAEVAGGHEWQRISAGGQTSCGLRTDGIVMCWGRDSGGETAQGSFGGNDSVGSSPLPIVGGHEFTQLTGGPDTRCGLVANGEAYCWGWGLDGQLGVGAELTRSAAPAKVLPPGGG